MKHLYSVIFLIFLITACGNNETENLATLSGEEKNVILTTSQSQTKSLENYLKGGTITENFTVNPIQYKGYSIIARTDQNTENEVVQQNASRICNKIKSDSRASQYRESQNHGTSNQEMNIDENGNFNLQYTTSNGTNFSSIDCVSN